MHTHTHTIEQMHTLSVLFHVAPVMPLKAIKKKKKSPTRLSVFFFFMKNFPWSAYERILHEHD